MDLKNSFRTWYSVVFRFDVFEDSNVDESVAGRRDDKSVGGFFAVDARK